MLASEIASIIPTITYLSAPQILSKRPASRLSNSVVEDPLGLPSTQASIIFQIAGGPKLRNRSELVTTNTEENAMAPAAMIGFNKSPKKG